MRKRSDGRWEGRIVVGHKENGKPIFKSVFGRTQKELLPKLEQLRRDYAGADLTEECRMPLGEWLEQWLLEQGQRLRPATVDGYRYCIRLIDQHLAAVPLDQLKKPDVQKMYNALLDSGLSSSTVRSVHMMLHEAMDAAVRKNLIVRNPTTKATLPKKEYAPVQVLNNEQLERFLNEIRSVPAWHDLFYVELTTGLRRGELCGLRWDDFDENAGRLCVRRTISYRHGKLCVGEPKTESGVRSILLPQSTADLLRNRKRTVQSEWIFPAQSDSNLPVHPESAFNAFKRILKKADLPDLPLHALRHTFSTQAIAAGVDPKTLSSILGHTNASFTLNTYTHVTSDMQKHASDIIGDMAETILGKDLTPWLN